MRQSKFNVGKDKSDRTFDGIIFDSVVEMKYFRDVILLEYNNGEIIYYERQKKYILQPGYKTANGKSILPIIYKADFYVKYKDGREEVIDVKGCPDSVAKLKKKMFEFVFSNIVYRWIAYSGIDGGFCDYEYIQKARKLRKKHKQECKKERKGYGEE